MEGSLPFDPWRLLEALVRKRRQLLWASAGVALLGFLGAYALSPYRLTVKLIRNRPPASWSASPAGQDFTAHDLSAPTMAQLMQSPALWRRAAARVGVAASPDQVAKNSAVSVVPGTELILVCLRGQDAAQTMRLINAYAEEAVDSFRDLQAQNAEEMNRLLRDKLPSVDRQLEQVNRDLARFHRATRVIALGKETLAQLEQGAELDQKSADIQRELETVELQAKSVSQEMVRQSPALIAAKEALGKALQRYTEEHPKVKELRAAIAAIEAQIAQPGARVDLEAAAGGSSVGNSLFLQLIELRTRQITLNQQLKQIADLKARWLQELEKLPEQKLEYAKVVAQSDSLTRLRSHLVSRQQEVQLLADNAMGSFHILERASLEDLNRMPKIRAGIRWGFCMGWLGLIIAGLWIMFLELIDGRIRTHGDLKRATRLPLLADLGELKEMTDSEQDRWAFQTWMVIKGHLQRANPQNLVCGFISSSHGEGCSTWVRLLAKAADKQGYQVLALAGSPPKEKLSWHPDRADSGDGSGLKPNGLIAPLEANHDLMSHAERSSLPILFLDQAWNLECRRQWQDVLRRWSSQPNLAVFVELPPASEPEGLLLSDNQWPLIWVCGKDMAQAKETRDHLEILRQTRCQLVGAVFNRVTLPPWRRRFHRLVGATLLINVLLAHPLAAQETGAAAAKPAQQMEPAVERPSAAQSLDPSPLSNPAGTNATDSGRVPATPQLADWQKHLTLGPGDVLAISLYDQPESTRTGLFIGPDGRLNYLQAQNIEAAGLTIDELRAKLEEALSKYYLTPRVVILPESYRSKKYVILGNVNQKGVFPLDRPTTIIEAVARARGFETSYQQRNALVLADLSRSFLVRKGEADAFKQVPVDFEALFLRGDWSQNIALVPGDYLYFPSLDTPEVYVLGNVRAPGIAAYVPDLSVLQAIISRGGFTDKSYRKKVLVIRGSFSHPQTFIVDASGVLAARNFDFPLKARDIVYVPRKPWAYLQELLEAAVSEYLRAMVVTWTGQNIGPITKQPFVPNIR